jgi:protein-tyrosine-phosphatase
MVRPAAANKVFLLAEVVTETAFDIPDPYSTDESPAVVAKEIIEMIERGYENILALALEKFKHQNDIK